MFSPIGFSRAQKEIEEGWACASEFRTEKEQEWVSARNTAGGGRVLVAQKREA